MYIYIADLVDRMENWLFFYKYIYVDATFVRGREYDYELDLFS